MFLLIRKSLIVSLSAALVVPAMAQTPDVEELWRIIQMQQRAIEALEAKLDGTEEIVTQTLEAVEVTADAIEVVKQRDVSSWGNRTSIGGYGEIHYNSLTDDALADGDDALSRADLHRYVLYVGHEFTDNIRFFSELEIEHSLAGDGAPGEVELEQAWFEMDLTQSHRLRAGIDTVPVGLINLYHEPNTFYGVERNRVETEIIPSTWWEAGIGLTGEVAPGWNYNLIFHSGLVIPTSGSTAFRPRSGRLKVAEADDQGLATTGRIRYTGIPGLEVAATVQYNEDITGKADNADIDATLFSTHLDWKHRSGFGLRALYARWDYGNDPSVGVDPVVFDAETLDGFYIEPAYRFSLGNSRWGDIGIFARYEEYDERNRVTPHRFEEFEQIVFGMNWWPHDNLAFKFDIQWQDSDATVDRLLDGFNVGLGYQF